METTPDFVSVADYYLKYGVYASLAWAGVILLYHEFRIFQIKDYKEKYDYVNLYEVRYFWYAMMALIVAGVLYANSLAAKLPTFIFSNVETWFYVRTFLTVCLGIVSYFAFYSLVRIYYPRFVEKRLNKLRNKPRLSPEGNIMRKLTEAEEASHLEASQFAEQQEVHAVEYDVWLDEKTGYKKIEKYYSYQHVIECPECGYVTLRIISEEVEKAPENDEPGMLLKHYKCSYCGHREVQEAAVTALSENIA